MALVKCTECEKMISDSSQKCIGCGAPINIESNKKKKIGWIIGSFFLLLIIAIVINKVNPENLVSNLENSTQDKIVAKKYNDVAADTFFYLNKVNSIKEIKDGVAYDVNNNSLGSFSVNGEREGLWKWYYKDNKLAYEGYYKKGLLNGYFKHYYENGKLFHEGAFLNGSLQEINEASGIPQSGRTGIHIFYWNNGRLKSKTNFDDGSRHGLSESWHSNGVKWEMAEMKNNRYDGLYQAWDESGACIAKGRYNQIGKFESD